MTDTLRMPQGTAPALRLPHGLAGDAAWVMVPGILLSWLCGTYPAAMPVFAPWQFSWLEYLGIVLPLLWYARGVARAPAAERPSVWRQAAFWIGMASMWAVTQTAFTNLSLHLFTATQGQQFVLHDLAPFFIALSWPGESLRRGMPEAALRALRTPPLRAAYRAVQQPVVAALLFIALLAGQVIPAVMFRVMLDWRAFDAMNIVMAVDGVLFWCLVLDPRPKPEARISFLTRMILAFLVMLPVMPIGGYITFTDQSFYDFYDICGRMFPSIPPMLDQRLGGIMMWIPSGLMNSIAVLLPLNALRAAEDKAERETGKVMIRVGGMTIDPSAWTGRP